ncbi:MAG: pilus assembly protein [Planctomycetia bacterium]|nr:pilus assembly protein [Planctomycetia bacterium]
MASQVVQSIKRRSNGQVCARDERVSQVRAGRQTRWPSGLCHRRGAAVVEFAVVAPVFFLLVFGMIEYGRLVMVQQILTNAAREGARVGVLDNSTTSDVTTACNRYLSSANIQNATIAVSPSPPSSAPAGGPVSVTVSVGFNQVSWLPSPLFLGGTTMTFTATMRRETMQ